MSNGGLDRRAVVASLVADPGGLLVVSGLGSSCYDLNAAGDRAENFYLWGAMGGAVMTGLGLALAQPSRRVLVITGDGEVLMQLGALAVAAAQHADNLAVLVLDNERYGETGSQRTHTALGADLAAIAAGCGWRATATVRTAEEIPKLRGRLRSEKLFVVVKIAAGEEPKSMPPRDGALLQHRFRTALGLPDR